jgi:hypothetical protein
LCPREHLVPGCATVTLEENLNLFFTRLEITGRIFGNWAIGHTRDGAVGGLVKRRIQYSLGREGLGDFYYDAYLNISRQAFDNIAQSRQGAGEESKKDSETKTLLAKLIGASAATILLTTIAKYSRKLFRVWMPADGSTQAIFSVGYAPGSVKFYGFCMQKPKPAPSTHSIYLPAYREYLASDLAEVYDRSLVFVKLFTAFMNTTDPTILPLTNVDNGDKIWSILQKFFWLITQSYGNAVNGAVETWQDFTHAIRGVDARVMDSGEGVKIVSREVKLEPDPDWAVLARKCLEVIKQESITVHSANIGILDNLEKNLS